MNNKYLLPILIAVLALAVIVIYVATRDRGAVIEDDVTISQPGDNSGGGRIIMPDPESGIEIQNVYENKIVYTTDMQQDAEKYRADCESRGGEFNSCGSSCPSDAEMCIQVCAYTCDLGAAK